MIEVTGVEDEPWTLILTLTLTLNPNLNPRTHRNPNPNFNRNQNKVFERKWRTEYDTEIKVNKELYFYVNVAGQGEGVRKAPYPPRAKWRTDANQLVNRRNDWRSKRDPECKTGVLVG